MITFEFRGKTYKISKEAAEAAEAGHLIKLPDGTILSVPVWTETCPPKPREFYVVKCTEAVEVAEK